MAIRQIRVGRDNLCYIIFCRIKKRAAIVDPGFDASKAVEYLSSNSLILHYIILTHHHLDHTRSAKSLKNHFPESNVIASKIDGKNLDVPVDIPISDNDELQLGEIKLKFLLTPGHTSGSICIIVNNKVLLTGDTLFIGDCGRTDLQGGNLEQMFHTLREKIMTLPNHLIIYPGHDYGDNTYDTLENQKKTNKTLLAKDIDDFSKIP